jgi:hypothetical protein
MTILLSSPPLASLVSDLSALGGMLIPLAALAMAAVVVIATHLAKNAERQRWHETARIALEKGLPIPSMPNPEDGCESPDRPGAASRQKQMMGFVTAGLINIAVGIGLYIGLAHLPGGAQEVRYFALIPGLVGAALLIVGLIYASSYRKAPD